MDDRVKLYVMGISYSQLHSGAFALLLAQEGGRYYELWHAQAQYYE